MRKLIDILQRHSGKVLILAILWTVFVLVACFMPGNDIPKVNIVNIDKVVHVILFGGFILLWGLGLFRLRQQRLFYLGLFIAAVILGVLVELIQSTSWVIGRSGDIWDVVADAVGAALGVWLLRFLLKNKKENGNV